MTSQLNVDTIADKAGSGVGMLRYKQHCFCESMVKYEWAFIHGTIATTNDSFNIDSITDNGTGDYTGTFTNAMSNDDFVCAGEVEQKVVELHI